MGTPATSYFRGIPITRIVAYNSRMIDLKNTSSPIFSIVIPVFNSRDYIEDAVRSALSQSFSEFEVILVDDGSSDESGAICSALTEQHSNVLLLRQNNQGPLLARRNGAKAASGAYLLFLDSDDRLHRNCLSTLWQSIKEFGADIVSFNYSTCESYSHVQSSSDLLDGFYGGERFHEARRSLCTGSMNQLCFKAIKRSVFDLSSDYSSFSSFRHGEDLFQLLPVFDNACSFLKIPNCLYYYRRSSNSGTFHYSSNQLSDIDKLSSRLIDYGKLWKMEEQARIGILLQYCYLLKILSCDKTIEKKDADREFEAICERIKAHTAKQKQLPLPLPWKFFVSAVLRKNKPLIKGAIALSNAAQALLNKQR